MNWLVNVRGTQLVLDECKRAGVERLIYTSTVTVVVGGEEVHHLDESAPYLENVRTHQGPKIRHQSWNIGAFLILMLRIILSKTEFVRYLPKIKCPAASYAPTTELCFSLQKNSNHFLRRLRHLDNTLRHL